MFLNVYHTLRQNLFWTIVGFAICLLSGYWLLMASDRYVSEAHVVIQKTDLPSGDVGLSGFISGMLGSGSSNDQLMLKDYLQSVDMLALLDARLKLREHYQDKQHDWVSRLWRTEMEWFHRYFLEQVTIYYDTENGVLQIRAEAYTPEMAKAITTMLVQEGEHFMNQQAQNLAKDQVQFLEQQLVTIKENLLKSRRDVLAYQNKNGTISPMTNVETLSGTLAQLEVKRIELDAELSAMRSYLVANHPSITQLEQQKAAIEKQMAIERDKLVSPGGHTMNAKVEEYQRLQFEAGFMQEVYKTALASVERGRIEAARTIKKMLVLQAPTTPEYPDSPRRFYNTLVSIIMVLLLAGIFTLIAAIIEEHKD